MISRKKWPVKVALPSSVSSLQDLSALIIEIRGYSKWFATNAIKERVHAKNATPPPTLSPGALELIRTSGSKKLLTQAAIDALISDLESAKTKAPTITITLAAPASRDIKQTLVAACRTNIAEDALVNFKFNSGILGGLVLGYGSHVFDWSFRRQILENRTAFSEVLKRV